MTLMIKPTLACQFKCDFCSAAYCQQQNTNKLDDELLGYIKKINPDTMIVSGGDPLLMSPDFYNDILSLNDKLTISITSNLWDFKLNPTKWVDLFKNDRFGVVTSFQYGNKRRKPDGTPYSESDFREMMCRWHEYVGDKKLSFISVIGNDNADRAIDHVYLAKDLNTECKVNNVYPFGKSTEYFPRYKMLDIYFKIIDLGLEEYETNVKNRAKGICPFNIDGECFKCNRSIIKNSDGSYRFSYCEELIFNGTSFDNLDSVTSSETLHINDYIEGERCLQCPLCRLCNGCKVHRNNAKQHAGYCENMTKYTQRIAEYGFKI